MTAAAPGLAAGASVLVVDDEALARARLRSLLGELAPGVQVAEAAQAVHALEVIARGGVDLALLDIHMPGLSGIELARRLRQLAQVPALVFVTAHAEHAVAAFELEALDYLTKPVRRERLLQTLQKWERTRSNQRPLGAELTQNLPEATLLIHERGQALRLSLDEVLFCRAEQKYVVVRTRDRSHLLDDSLTELEERFPAHFVRIHRSTIVARRALRALERSDDPAEGETWNVRLDGLDEALAVSRRQLTLVREALARP